MRLTICEAVCDRTAEGTERHRDSKGYSVFVRKSESSIHRSSGFGGAVDCETHSQKELYANQLLVTRFPHTCNRSSSCHHRRLCLAFSTSNANVRCSNVQRRAESPEGHLSCLHLLPPLCVVSVRQHRRRRACSTSFDCMSVGDGGRSSSRVKNG